MALEKRSDVSLEWKELIANILFRYVHGPTSVDMCT